MFIATFIVLSFSTAASGSAQTPIKDPVVLCQSLCWSLLPPHPPSDQCSLYTLTIYTIPDQLLGHVQTFTLCLFNSLEFMRHTFKPATQHEHIQEIRVKLTERSRVIIRHHRFITILEYRTRW